MLSFKFWFIMYDRLVHCQQKTQMLYLRLTLQIFYGKEVVTHCMIIFKYLLANFLMNWNENCFFQSVGNFPLSIQDLKITSKDFKIDSPQFLTCKIWSYHGCELYFYQDSL